MNRPFRQAAILNPNYALKLRQQTLTLTIGSVATFLAIYMTATWLFYQIVGDFQGKEKKGNKSLLVDSVFLLFLILGLELVGFVNP